MQANYVAETSKFKPVKIELIFENEEELTGNAGFVRRFDRDVMDNGLVYMSHDPACKAIRNALKTVGY